MEEIVEIWSLFPNVLRSSLAPRHESFEKAAGAACRQRGQGCGCGGVGWQQPPTRGDEMRYKMR